MFRAFRQRFSKDDATKTERAAPKAETLAKRRERAAQSQREHSDRGDRHSRGGGGG